VLLQDILVSRSKVVPVRLTRNPKRLSCSRPLAAPNELRLTPEYGGTDVHMKGKGLSILKRQSDGSWKFWRGINNMTPQPLTKSQ